MNINKALFYYSNIFKDVCFETHNYLQEKELFILSQMDASELSASEKNRQNILSLKLQKENELNRARNNYRAALYYFNMNELDEFELISYEWAVFEIMDEIDEIDKYN